MATIPPELEPSHILAAAAEIDAASIPPKRKPRVYDVIVNGKAYPVKLLVEKAIRIVKNDWVKTTSFTTILAKDWLEDHGYPVRELEFENDIEAIIAEESDESAFPEGGERFLIHRRLERDGALPKKAKARYLTENDNLACMVCGFDFFAMYGERGEGFIECHHMTPVSELIGDEPTKIADLAMVCSNCHRMLHRGPELLTIDQLRDIVEKYRETSGR